MTIPLESPIENSGKWSAVRRVLKSRHLLLVVLGLALAWHALRGVAWPEVWDLLDGIGPMALLVIVVINLLMLPLMTARWWLLLRLLGSPVGLLPACAYRLAANAISYLTPGPHFGGEPLSIYLLHHRHGLPLSSATISVAVDRSLELLASFVVLTLCMIDLAFFSETGLFNGSQGLSIVIALTAAFTWFLAALFTGRRPLSRAVGFLKRFYVGCFRYFPLLSRKTGSLMDSIAQGEAMAESLFREHPYHFLPANLFSLGYWLVVFAEFWLMSFFLGFPLSFSHLTAVVVAARLAFYTPLPAGIGVLESALPWVTATLGLGSALGLSFCLIIRFRDLLFSLAGLGITMKCLTCRRKAGIINHESGKLGIDDLLK
jgi:uncharacterized protein (TIRG00374 family)